MRSNFGSIGPLLSQPAPKMTPLPSPAQLPPRTMTSVPTSIATSGKTLPSQFVLCIPSRSTKKDPFANYILLNATPTPDGKAIRLEPAPTQPDTAPPYRRINAMYYPVILRRTLLNIVSGLPQNATLIMLEGLTVSPPGGGTPLHVMRFRNERLLQFLPAGVRRNVPFVDIPSKPSVVTSPAFPIASPPLLTPVGGAGTETSALTTLIDTLTQINNMLPETPTPAPAPVQKKKVAAAVRTVSDLSAHVAKQLLALARIRKEECPIIAEEFSDGNTAVMPCGHLFSRMGIEESFKKEPRKCPACRAAGNPTFV